MIRARFGDFWKNGDIAAAAVLYILFENERCLYVGISKWDVWRRWFDPYRGHISNRKSIFCTRVGAHVVDNLPASMDWEIELWSLDDCLEALKGLEAARHLTLERCEELMIERNRPIFNVTNNRYDCTEIAEMDDSAISAFYDSVAE